MVGEPEAQSEKADEARPAKPRPVIVRVFRALKRYENRRRRRAKEHPAQHPVYERMMALVALVVAAITAAILAITAGIFWRQLDEMRDEQRPWVFISQITLANPAGIGNAMDQVIYNENGLFIGFLLTFKNSGHLPAINVHENLKSLPLRGGVSLNNIYKIENTICHDMQMNTGMTIFLNDVSKLTPAFVSISKKEVDELPFPNLTPMVIGCVIYDDPSGREHHTPYIWEIKAVKNAQMCCVIPLDKLSETPVAIGQLSLGGMPPD
jgi:hypothetical protein